MVAMAVVAAHPLHQRAPEHPPAAPVVARHAMLPHYGRPEPLQAPPPPPAPVPNVVTHELDSTLTFYDCVDQGFCGDMANGEQVYEGAAACSYNLEFGTRFVIPNDPTNRVYVCKDRGLLNDTHVDIFWNHPDDGWRWQSAVGSWGPIEIIDSCDAGRPPCNQLEAPPAPVPDAPPAPPPSPVEAAPAPEQPPLDMPPSEAPPDAAL